MAHRADIPDMRSLLCEKCGYILDNIDPAGECPECGIAISSVQPRLRSGSPWQYHRSPTTLIRTWWLLITHPRSCWDDIRIHNASALSLMGWGLLCSTALPGLLFCGYALYTTIENNAFGVFAASMMVTALISVVFLIIAMVYAEFAVRRMKFTASHREYRIETNIARTIIGHASVGLALIPMMIGTAILSMMLLAVLGQNIKNTTAVSLTAMLYLGYALWLLVLASIPTGLIVFELLCTLGVGRMRYRNPHPEELKEMGGNSAQQTDSSRTRPHIDTT